MLHRYGIAGPDKTEGKGAGYLNLVQGRGEFRPLKANYSFRADLGLDSEMSLTAAMGNRFGWKIKRMAIRYLRSPLVASIGPLALIIVINNVTELRRANFRYNLPCSDYGYGISGQCNSPWRQYSESGLQRLTYRIHHWGQNSAHQHYSCFSGAIRLIILSSKQPARFLTNLSTLQFMF